MINKKSFLIGILIGCTVTTVFNTTVNTINKKDKKEIKIERTITKSEEGIYLDKGDVFQELTDDSFIIYNDETKLYIFQPSDLGDWNYQLNTKEELNNIVSTYLELKNQ